MKKKTYVTYSNLQCHSDATDDQSSSVSTAAKQGVAKNNPATVHHSGSACDIAHAWVQRITIGSLMNTKE